MQHNKTKAPWHLWLFGLIALLWSSMGAFDFVMTQTQNEAYMSKFTQAQLEFFYGFPIWMVAAWAVAVWGGVIGAILLLLRNQLAVPVFLGSMLCVVITTFRNYAFADGMEVMGGNPTALALPSLIFVFSMAFFLYAQEMRKKGVLG